MTDAAVNDAADAAMMLMAGGHSSSMLASDQKVWLDVEDDDAWVLCSVEGDSSGAEVKLKRLHAPPGVSNEITVSKEAFSKLRLATGEWDEPADDLTQLEDVNDGAMLHTLRQRFERDDIYTAIGPVVVAINPYKPVPTCSVETFAQLRKMPADSLPPHVFTITNAAYTGMLAGEADRASRMAQSILISGESGAGKTETNKMCMSCLAELSSSGGQLTEQALESGIMLEAFGNARTVYNNNSSRFGKWCAVYFDGTGKMAACKVRSYLLEKSRVVGPTQGERNYHIFYHMLAGASAEERKKFGLLAAPSDYKYTTGETVAPGIDDKEEWLGLLAKLELLMFNASEQAMLFQTYSAVLLIGNLTFKPGKGDKFEVADGQVLKDVAFLLQVVPTALEAKLTTKVIDTGKGSSSYTVPLTAEQCADSRDALAKAVYVNAFEWIISKCNTALGQKFEISEDNEKFIGLLDIFGFENFAFNTFEQLCINFTNEKLQQHFMDALVKLQQADYKREAINVQVIAFPDNSKQIELIDHKSKGVMAMLDEECAVPKGSEINFVDKMTASFKGNELFELPKRGKRGTVQVGAATAATTDKKYDGLQFLLTHYAGPVMYTAYGWMDKNRGTLHPDLANVLSVSDSRLVQTLFPPMAAGEKRATVGASFRASLRALSATMQQTAQQYIRCIKPNGQKKKTLFDGQFVVRQLNYTGVGAVVEIQKKGYPVSMPQAEFIRRYRCVAFDQPALISKDKEPKVVCENIAKAAQTLAGKRCKVDILGDHMMQVGKTKVYLKEEVVKFFEKPRREVWGKAAAKLQRATRRRLARRVFKIIQMHKAGVKLVRDAMARREMEEAGEKLDALVLQWEQSKLKPTSSPRLAPLYRELGEMEVEIVNLEAGLEVEGKALEDLKQVLRGAAGKSEKEAYIMLKKAMQVAQEASSGYMPELTDAIAQVQDSLNKIMEGLGIDPTKIALMSDPRKEKGRQKAAAIIDFGDINGFDDDELDEAEAGKQRRTGKANRNRGKILAFEDDDGMGGSEDDEAAPGQRKHGKKKHGAFGAMGDEDAYDEEDDEEAAPTQRRRNKAKFGDMDEGDGMGDEDDEEAVPTQRRKNKPPGQAVEGDNDGDEDDEAGLPSKNHKKLTPEEQMLMDWEAEIENERLGREALRKQKQADLEKDLRDDPEMEIIDIILRNDFDFSVQASGGVKRCKGYTVASTGVQFNDGNMVTVITAGGLADKDDLLRIGDIVIAVEKAELSGDKVVDSLTTGAAAEREQHLLTVARYAGGGRGNLPGGQHEGWVFALKAKDGEALLMERPKKCWAVLEGNAFTLYETKGRGQRVPTTTPLKGALCKAPVTELKGKKLDQPPIIQQLIAQRRFPFTLTWSMKEVEYDIVCATTTSADRTAWLKALNAQLKRMKAGAPTSGWLMKQGGRQMSKMVSKLASMSWKRRWFVLTQPTEGRPATFAYYDGPQATLDEPKGLVLLNASAQLFMTDKTKKPHCFCIQSIGASDNKPVTTILSASSNEEVRKWMRSLQEAIKQSGGAIDHTAKLSKLAAANNTMMTSMKMDAAKIAMYESLKKLDEPELMELNKAKLVDLLKYLHVEIPKAALNEKLRDGKFDKRPLIKLVRNHQNLNKIGTNFAGGGGGAWGLS